MTKVVNHLPSHYRPVLKIKGLWLGEGDKGALFVFGLCLFVGGGSFLFIYFLIITETHHNEKTNQYTSNATLESF